ncbi:MAG: PAAR domain-containing protein [Desulfobacterales bacterium]|nr:PAAR domain-containing protein [Desulfobacterales bacterium]
MGKPAARLGDTTAHGSPLLGAPCTNVLIGNKPAWRIGDQHTCPIPNAPPPAGPGTPHGPGVTTPVPDGGSGICLIGGKPAARVGDIVTEPGALVPLPPPNNIAVGEFTVLIGMGGGGGGGAGGPGPQGSATACGDPVNVVTGEVTIDQLDFVLPGYFPLAFTRMYRSTSFYVGPLGKGWSHAFDQAVVEKDGEKNDEKNKQLFLRNSTGQLIPLPPLQIGKPAFNPDHKIKIYRPNKIDILISEGRRRSLFRRSPSTSTNYLLIAIYDKYGNPIELQYDHKDRLIEIEDTTGRLLILSYEGSKLKSITVQAPEASTPRELSRYYYQGDLLIAVADASGAKRRFEYTDDRVVCHRTALGYGIYYQYDAQGRCVGTWGEDGYLSRTIHYDTKRRRSLAVDSLGRQTVYTYNEMGVVIDIEDADGGIFSTIYDDHYNQIAQIDEKGAQRSFAFDDSGREIVSIDANGNPYLQEYDQWDRPIAAIYPNGVRWEFEYDEKGSLITSRGPNDVEVRYAYNGRGQLIREEGPAGFRQFKYDGWANVIEVQETDGTRQNYRYDIWGRLIEAVDQRGSRTTLEYDAMDRITAIYRDGRIQGRYTYDPMGNILSQEDALGQRTDFQYNGWGYVIKRMDPETALADGRKIRPTTDLTWDAEGNLIRINGPGDTVWNLEYNPVNRITAVEQPGGRRCEYALDPAGNRMREQTPGGNEIAFEYDDSDQLVKKSFADGKEFFYTYDEMDHLVEISSNDSQVSFEWDENDLLASEEVNGATCRYFRDAAGELIGQEYPDGETVRYKIGPNGRIEAVLLPNRQEIDFKYNDEGDIREIVFPNGVIEHFKFDSDSNRLVKSIDLKGEELIRKEVRLDHLDRIAKVSDSIRGETCYTYDSRDLLLEERCQDYQDEGVLRYAYDLRGNIVSRNNVRFKIGAGSEILHDGRFEYQYDDAGQLIRRIDRNDQVTAYRYDPEGLLTEVCRPDGTFTYYEYDLLGRRIAKIHAGDRVEFSWNGDQLMEERELKSGLKRRFIYIPDSDIPLAHIETSLLKENKEATEPKIVFYHTDMLGTPTELSDDQGEFVCLPLFSPEKTLWPTDLKLSTPLRFPGQYFDPETGLHYNGQRYYDPFLERYLTPDPVPVFGGGNPYAYGVNRVNWIDPLGLWPENPAELLRSYKRYRRGCHIRRRTPMNSRSWLRSFNRLKSNNIHGNNIEAIHRRLHGNNPKPRGIQTSRGMRYPDAFDGNSYHEVKSGYAKLCPFNERQIEKDAEIMQSTGRNVEWHLYDGYEQALLDRLKQNGIRAFDRVGRCLNP